MIVSYVIAILFALVVPVVIGILLVRRYRIEWMVLLYGALALFAAQFIQDLVFSGIGNLLNSGSVGLPAAEFQPLFYAVLIGLITGILHQAARWGAFRFLKDRVNSWGGALTLGAGHGAAETLLYVGLPMVLTLISVFSLMSNGVESLNLSPEESASIQGQLDAFQAMPWYSPLATIVERILALSTHLLLSVMVWLSFVQKKKTWLAAAVLWHAFITGVGVFVSTLEWAPWTQAIPWSIFIGINVWLLVLIYRQLNENKALNPAE
ncbi:MAG TPA: YhfC family glutamic-type intramembrane protease [Anaerolineaceae bacterium]|nr:YhfC family glutamic-type intramembrane protease [Anaerolineaceae bacterium]